MLTNSLVPTHTLGYLMYVSILLLPMNQEVLNKSSYTTTTPQASYNIYIYIIYTYIHIYYIILYYILYYIIYIYIYIYTYIFWQSSATGALSTLVTSVVLYSLTRATLMNPGKDETPVCGYICSEFIH